MTTTADAAARLADRFDRLGDDRPGLYALVAETSGRDLEASVYDCLKRTVGKNEWLSSICNPQADPPWDMAIGHVRGVGRGRRADPSTKGWEDWVLFTRLCGDSLAAVGERPIIPLAHVLLWVCWVVPQVPGLRIPCGMDKRGRLQAAPWPGPPDWAERVGYPPPDGCTRAYLLPNLFYASAAALRTFAAPAARVTLPDGRPLSEVQRRVLEVLAGQALTGDALAAALDYDRKHLLADHVKALRAAGRVRNDRRVGGYYRPDDPPPVG